MYSEPQARLARLFTTAGSLDYVPHTSAAACNNSVEEVAPGS
jgi:hypothetical protein